MTYYSKITNMKKFQKLFFEKLINFHIYEKLSLWEKN